MLKKYKKTLILSTLVLLIPIAVGLLLWNRLPDPMPSHWNIHGEVDSWSSKAFAVFGLPCFMVGIHWLCVLASCADPSRKNYHPKMFKLVLWICPGITLVIHTLVYCTALGATISVNMVMPLLVGFMFIVVGNLLPKCHRSYTMGINLPWTLNSEENSNSTHRFGGKVWVIGGIITMLTAFFGNFWILIGILLLIVLLPTIYSYTYYRKHEQDK